MVNRKIKMRTKWTRNQKLLSIGLLITFLGVIINFYQFQKVSNQQFIIEQRVDKINATIGEFSYLKADVIDADLNFSRIFDFPIHCPTGTYITFINFSGGYTLCEGISVNLT